MTATAVTSIVPVLLSEEQATALFGVSVRKFAELRAEAWMPLPEEHRSTVP